MKKNIFIIMILFSCTANLYSQMELVIENIKVSNINPKLDDENFNEDEENGPYVYLKCLLINRSNKDIDISPLKSDIHISFHYKEMDYETEVVALPFIDNELLTIKKESKEEFYVGSYILLGTKLWSEHKSDYSATLLGLLPTIRVKYKDPIIECYSTQIMRVEIHDDQKMK